MNMDVATVVYSYFFIVVAFLTGISLIAKHTIRIHTDDLKDKLSRIEYALYNDGKTGLINKVEELLENQQSIRLDVEVMKAQWEIKPARKSRAVK